MHSLSSAVIVEFMPKDWAADLAHGVIKHPDFGLVSSAAKYFYSLRRLDL